MWSKFKWDMFVTSFIPLWLSIIIFDVWDIVYNAITEFPQDGKFVGRLLCFVKNNIISLASVIIIFTVVIISIHGISSFLKERECSKQNPNGTIKKVKKANKLSSEFLLAYILPLIAFDFSNLKSLALFVVYFAILAFLCIRNNNIYTNIFLEFKRYRIYLCDIERLVPGDKMIIYYDSLIISKDDLTLSEDKSIKYWDCGNYIYIHIKENIDNE
jgi:hypothetical protein